MKPTSEQLEHTSHRIEKNIVFWDAHVPTLEVFTWRLLLNQTSEKTQGPCRGCDIDILITSDNLSSFCPEVL